MDAGKQLARSHDISTKVAVLLQTRTRFAQNKFRERLGEAWERYGAHISAQQVTSWDFWNCCYSYGVDFAQRSMFLDTLRQRGNNFMEDTWQGLPPVPHFGCETVLDGRGLDRPVNYALVRIVSPAGVTVDPKRRPYLIIDPRAGHGPGIGGFKDDSQVGVAIREKHPVYFVIFFRDPVPGQTVLDVCAAEQQFVRKVRELHPASGKPAIVGDLVRPVPHHSSRNRVRGASPKDPLYVSTGASRSRSVLWVPAYAGRT